CLLASCDPCSSVPALFPYTTLFRSCAFALDPLRVNITDLHLGAGPDTCMLNGFNQRLIRIEQFHVLAHHGNFHGTLRALLSLDHGFPFAQISGTTLQPETLDHNIV